MMCGDAYHLPGNINQQWLSQVWVQYQKAGEDKQQESHLDQE